jgi:LysM domain
MVLTTLLPEAPSPAQGTPEQMARPLAPVRPSGYLDTVRTQRSPRRTSAPPRAIPCTSARPGPRQLRLTTRGRVVVALLWVVIVVTAGFGVTRTWETSEPLPTQAVVVSPGDTLWDLAVEARPGDDPRATIAHIVEINRLGPWHDIHPGDELLVPSE